MLDFGCGRGKNSNYLSKRGIVYGIDISSENIALAQRDYPHIYFGTLEGGRLPYSDGMFDEIHAYDVLEHVDDLESVMLELYRVLKKRGILVIEVPYYKSEDMLVKLNPNYLREMHHVRVFQQGDIDKLLGRFEFSITKKSKRKFVDNIYFAILFVLNRHTQSQCGDVAGSLSRLWQNLCLLFSEDLFRKHRYWLYSPVWFFTLPIGMLLSKIFPKTIRTVAVKR